MIAWVNTQRSYLKRPHSLNHEEGEFLKKSNLSKNVWHILDNGAKIFEASLGDFLKKNMENLVEILWIPLEEFIVIVSESISAQNFKNVYLQKFRKETPKN